MRIGISLGAGGARGLGHIRFLEVFEELGVKPSIISGASIGAIIGAVYSAGMDTKEIKESINDIIFEKNAKFWEIHKRSDFIKMFNFIDPEIKQGGLIKGEKFVNFLGEKLSVSTFEELKIPLRIAATDFKENSCVDIHSGDLLNAIRASYAIPGLFTPVELNGRILIDGGVSNPLPYDLIYDKCDICIAIDSSANKTKQFDEIPAAYEILFAGFSMLQRSIIEEKLKRLKPHIYIDSDVQNVRIHEFTKVNSIYEQVEGKKEELKRKLSKLLES